MCGRYAFFSPAEAVRRVFGVREAPALAPRYNVAPTQPVAVVREASPGDRRLAMLHWGLIPSWAKERSIGNRMINARAETVAEKPSFKHAFRKRRCLVLADGFYEWKRTSAGKTPMYIKLATGKPFAFAGLWESWNDPAGDESLESCTIVTTDAAASIAEIHNRMPVVLPTEAFGPWLDPSVEDVAVLSRWLGPCDPSRLAAWPVSRRVNNPRHEGPDLIEPVPAA